MENTTSLLRNEIGAYMTTLGNNNSKVVVVNADLAGTCRNRSFADVFPERHFNMGIAEQNAVAFSAGLAHEGFIPYTFSMAPFLSMRACEQCRTDIAYAKLPVRLMGVYAGVSGGISGATHWAIEDCGIMSSIPEMIVMEPCDENAAKRLLDLSLEYQGPMYIRSTIEPVRNIYPENISVSVGGSREILSGSDGVILCGGVTVQYAIDAAEQLRREQDIFIGVIDMYSIKPIDKNAIIRSATTGNVLVVQDHNIVGGLGSMVATVIAEENLSTNFKILGIPDVFVPMAHAKYLYHMFEMDVDGIKTNLINMMSER